MKFEYKGKEYTLEFNRATVTMAERAGFTMEDFDQKLMTRIPELFYYAFKMHHPEVTKKLSDEILFEGFNGLTASEMKELGDLYAEPYKTLINTEEDGEEKNERKVKML